MQISRSACVAFALLGALMLNGCATNMIEGLKTSGRWLLPDKDHGPDGAYARRNEAALYAQYRSERALFLARADNDDDNQADPTRLRQRVLELAPIGSDIARAKVCLELNGFACSWQAPTHHAIGCDIGSTQRLHVNISSRHHAIAKVAVSAPSIPQ